MEFPQILSSLMSEQGISAYRMYKDLGIPDSLVGYWKKGKRSPSADQLTKLSNYFGVSVDYLLGKEVVTEISLLDHALIERGVVIPADEKERLMKLLDSTIDTYLEITKKEREK